MLNKKKLLLVALLSIGVYAGSAQDFSHEHASDPIAFIGHGAIFDKEGREINVTPEFIKETQKYYLNALYAQASPDQRLLFDGKKERILSGVENQTQNVLIENSLLIDWLIKQVKPSDSGSLASKNNMLKQYLHSQIPEINQPMTLKLGEILQLPKDLDKRLKKEGLLQEEQIGEGPKNLDYITACTNAGVPIPPDWGDIKWKNKGQFDKPFISASLPYVEVFAYDSTSPEGLCLALPRAKSDKTENELVGIICLAKHSSNACFWDNQRNKQQFPIPKGATVKITEFAGGPELNGGTGGTCTKCHAGENPYIIHPKTALGLPNLAGLKLRSDDWYKPMVDLTWPQNPGPTNILDSSVGTSSCTECHTQKGSGGRFPKVSTELDGYCNVILPQAATKTMPPSKPSDPDYSQDVSTLLAACKTSP